MTITHAQAAKAMGMKTREIRDVAARPGGGYLVTTFDGARCELLPGKAPSPAGADEQPAGDEAGVAAKPAKPAKKEKGGRGKKGGKDADQPVDVYPAGGDVAARLAWVGDRADRAAAALEVEQDRDDNPDAELVAQLQQLAGAATG
jgi:hypothetical protein